MLRHRQHDAEPNKPEEFRRQLTQVTITEYSEEPKLHQHYEHPSTSVCPLSLARLVERQHTTLLPALGATLARTLGLRGLKRLVRVETMIRVIQ